MSFAPNDKVQLANDPSRVGQIERPGPSYAGEQYFHVFWGGSVGTTTVSERDLVPHVTATSPLESLAAGRLGGYAEFQRLITLQRLTRDQPLRNNVYAFNASRTRFFPYQFKPLLKFLESSRNRLLICDEVGLGKTIEAGLILLELRARQTMRLTLVVCPSNLRNKWRIELRTRFGEDFQIMDAPALRQFFQDFEEAPDRVTLNGIVSLETLRGEAIRSRLEELGIAWDLVIIDEAHHLRNFGTAQRHAGELVTAGAQSVIMLTATPVHLGLQNLFSLLNLLDDEEFPEQETTEERFRENEWIVRAQSALHRIPAELDQLIHALELSHEDSVGPRAARVKAVLDKALHLQEMHAVSQGALTRGAILDLQRDVAELNLLGHILTRTRKRDVQVEVAVRRARAVELSFSPAEQAFYSTVTALIRKENEARTDTPLIQSWRLLTPQRRLASSIQGMVEYYRELDGSATTDDPDDFDDLVDNLADPEHASEADLRTQLAQLVRAWPLDGPDTKYEALLNLLGQLAGAGRGPKVLVFATFKHTIRYLERRLKGDGFGVLAISGDTAAAERSAIIDRFRDDGDIDVMISSRVGSEGLDFQFCSTLVNYDLPWNPMEVEQRIGRLDRIGQAAPSILVCNLWVAGSIEERILRRLYDRIGIFTNSIGDLESILGDIASELQHQLIRAVLDPSEAALDVERVGAVIDRRAREMENLEASAAQFIGVDSFFEDEVRSIQTSRRYVTGEQLYRFVTDYLRTHAPRTRLEYDPVAQEGYLYPDTQLVRAIRESGRASESLNIVSAVGHGVPITFDAQVAYREPHYEFLSVLHPLIGMITEHHERFPPPASAQHVVLRDSTLAPGFYFFFVFRSHIRSARAFNSLDAVFLDEDLSPVAERETAEALLGEMVERGESAQDPVELDPQLAMEACAQGELSFLRELQELKSREVRTNDVFIEQRLASIRSFLDRNIARKSEQLTRGIADNRKDRYLRMIRGHIARLENERERRVSELERLRDVASDHVIVAAGVLEIV